jgi:hypothetical protein
MEKDATTIYNAHEEVCVAALDDVRQGSHRSTQPATNVSVLFRGRDLPASTKLKTRDAAETFGGVIVAKKKAAKKAAPKAAKKAPKKAAKKVAKKAAKKPMKKGCCC